MFEHERDRHEQKNTMRVGSCSLEYFCRYVLSSQKYSSEYDPRGQMDVERRIDVFCQGLCTGKHFAVSMNVVISSSC